MALDGLDDSDLGFARERRGRVSRFPELAELCDGGVCLWWRVEVELPDDVVRIFGRAVMSVSSFHRHFRAVTSMTMIQFRKEIRLREAGARLIAEPGDVAGASFAVGYDSPSQFSREYRRMFGVPPSRDALALREAAVLPSH